MTTSQQIELRRKIAARAAALLREGYHCSEAVVKAVGPSVVRDWCPACTRMATGFGGGVGGTEEELCGALAGGIMVIGALFGRTTLEDDTLVQRLAAKLRQRFAETFETTQCVRLLEDVVRPAEGGLGSCAVVVERATMILLGVLADAGVYLQDGAVAESTATAADEEEEDV
ncbi:MAG: C-GCAxxG-C-C family protein [Paracoccaceae bacterium]